MLSYTEQIQNELYEGKWSVYDTSEDDYAEMVDYLNSSNFRSFGEGLISVISKKTLEDESALDCLKRCFKEKNIDIKELGSPNTPKNWLNGGERPKKGEDSRRKMFVFAFALGLSVDETVYLFQRVFLDRAFNPRNHKELIYYYCIENNLPFSKAVEMISQVDFENSDVTDKTVYTKVIADVIEQSKSESDIIQYINSHPHNFSINNIAAKDIITQYISRAKKFVLEEIQSFDSLYVANKDKDSTNFMYETIIGQTITTDRGTDKSLFKNADLPKEISTSFPTPQIFAKLQKNPTYDELRKMLIVLFSYCFWYKTQKTNDYADIDDYVEQLNDLLTEANLPTIYPGNPMDWLFCFCTMADRPLDTFRAILSEVLDVEE